MDLYPRSNPRKRKRRRGTEKPAIHAQLIFEDRLKGDIGLVSEDIFADLFPSHPPRQVDDSKSNTTDSEVCYIAITPRIASSLCQPGSAPWIILAVRQEGISMVVKQLPRSTIHFPSSSSALESFVKDFQKLSPNGAFSTIPSSFDVQVLDVVPLPLETVVVGVDEIALEKLEDANRKFRSGYGTNGRGFSSNTLGVNASYERDKERHTVISHNEGARKQWRRAVREALFAPRIVHTGDVLPLPLPSHPVTHVSPPPVTIEFCEPVAQGLLVPHTKVVIISTGGRSKRPIFRTASHSYASLNGVVEEEEDTSNEQFYSATEDRTTSPARLEELESGESVSEDTETEISNDEDTDLSDGEGDAIGLKLPLLPTIPSGSDSVFSSEEMRTSNNLNNGTASPGSVYSSFSASTVRGGQSNGTIFQSQGLLASIPESYLHPKPNSDEDEEARVFVDTTFLPKIGCFSGDWVSIEPAPESYRPALSSWGFGAADSSEEVRRNGRVAKLYALPGQYQRRPRYAIDKTGSRHSSSSASFEKLTSKVYLSPLLLANLGNPESLRIVSLMSSHTLKYKKSLSKLSITGASSPPLAKEVTLSRLSTPLATEIDVHPTAFLSFKMFCKQTCHVVKEGDLLAIPIDTDLGRAVYQGSGREEDIEQEELLSRPIGGSVGNSSKVDIAWYKIKSVVSEANKSAKDLDTESAWGNIAILGPRTHAVVQTGYEPGKLPAAMRSSWPYYLGTKCQPVTPDVERSKGVWPAQIPIAFVSRTRRRLRELISTATSPQAIHLGLPPVAILLHSTQRHIGKTTVTVSTCADLGLHAFSIDAYDILTAGGSGGDVNTAGLLEARAARAMTCGAEFTVLLIKHIAVLTADRMVNCLRNILLEARVIVATTTEIEKLPEGLRSLFTHVLEMTAPDEGEREGLLRDIVQDAGVPIFADVDFSSVAIKTAALVAGDLVDVVDRAKVARQERLEKLARSSNERTAGNALQATIRDIQLAGGDATRCVIKADFDVAVDAGRKNFADAIGAPKIPNVGWNDVGGLTNVKDAVMETIQLPLERPELFAKGMKKRSGILFYGPPGTGKTLLAKAIATEFSLNFFSVKGPELLNMYIGESEANVRRVFQRARDARPCVVFFDELDSVAPKRGNQGDSGGVMDRIVSQLLAELDGMSNGDDGNGGDVFVIGATNRPDLLDQALLRPGRFDKMLYLGVSDTHEKQLTILEALTRKFTLNHALSLPTVASRLPFTYTGADLYALCSDAMLKAITRKASAVDAKVKAFNLKTTTRNSSSRIKQPAWSTCVPITAAYFFDHLATKEDTEVVVEQEDFEAAMRELVPSVSVKELEHYDQVRRSFEEGDQEQKTEKAPSAARLLPPSATRTPSTITSKEGREVGRRKQIGNGYGNGSSNGHGEGRGKVDQPVDEEEFVLRTEGLSLGDRENDYEIGTREGGGSTNGIAKGKTKGKGKQVINQRLGFGFGDAAAGDDDLYNS